MKKIYTFADGTTKTLTYKAGDMDSLLATTDEEAQAKFYPTTIDTNAPQDPKLPPPKEEFENLLVSVQEVEE